MQLSQKWKKVSEISFVFSELKLNFQHFQKKMTLPAHVFLNLRTPKNVVSSISKKLLLREPFDK